MRRILQLSIEPRRPLRLLHVGAAALNQTPLDWDGNLANIRAAIAEARRRDVSLLCLPELCITGYGCEDAFFSPSVLELAQEFLLELAAETDQIAVTAGLPVLHHGGLFNACALLVDGRIAGLAAKQQLAGDGVHYEPRWFKPWPAHAVATTMVDGRDVPLGDLLFDLAGVRIGFEICEDAWTPRRPAAGHVRLGADLILNPSASHFAFHKGEVRSRLVREASRAYGVTYIHANLLGNEAGRVIYDGQTLIGRQGKIVGSGPRLSFEPVVLCDATVDVDEGRMQRAQSSSHLPDVASDSPAIVACDFTWPAANPTHCELVRARWETSEDLEAEEFTRAVALGLYDYLRKSRTKGFVVSLSGGADSAAVACLVALMVRLATEEIGGQRLASTIGQEQLDVASDQFLANLTAATLTTVYQATENSSNATRQSARAVAEGVGATHHELEIGDLTAAYTKKIEDALGRKLTWETDDLTLQNIQARVRGPAAWMLANAKQALLLATSNRSEAAVGYATMDGDTCGGISPIAGIDKAFLRTWLAWLEKTGPEGIGPVPALQQVNRLAPTAELRPQDFDQTDEQDLMPYDLLDAIEHHAIGRKRSPAEVRSLLRSEFPQYAATHLDTWIRRFFTLWSRNQWKRERYAPSLHVDDKNLDPKTWCRFPILSGGFRRELRDLDDDATTPSDRSE